MIFGPCVQADDLSHSSQLDDDHLRISKMAYIRNDDSHLVAQRKSEWLYNAIATLDALERKIEEDAKHLKTGSLVKK